MAIRRVGAAEPLNPIVEFLRVGGPTPYEVHALGQPGAKRAAKLEGMYQSLGAPADWSWRTSALRRTVVRRREET